MVTPLSELKMTNIPFDKDFVMKVTLGKAKKAVKVSIDKTLARIPEFPPGSPKSIEAFETLLALGALRKHLDGFHK